MEPGAAAPSTDYLEDFLTEFDQVVQDFDKGQPCQYEQHLAELKRRPVPSLYDSGIDDSGSSGTSPSSSLNTSEEELSAAATSSFSTARLGDTQDLEAFIADLDRALEEM
ncbi:regulator of cell cycle RGCC-like [Tiliqua scincoides]|uniref:regulator of cell cycle RGCC-like n=1 Tax=Tiliqua scincoides TaxID=71010 RepID=UPI003461CB8E